MTIAIKWFPPSWIQVKTEDLIIYIDPAYLRTYFTKHPHKIEFSKWPGPIDGLPEKLEKAAMTIKPKVAIPMHHLKANPQKFEKKIESKSDVRGLPLRIGEIYRLN